MTIVQPVKDSLALLTREVKEEGGRITGQLCDKDGNPLGRDQQHLRREVYVDSLSGERVMRISHEEKITYDKDGVEVAQGQGEVHGWFVDAPDYTINGAHGDGAPGKQKAAEHAEA